MSWQLRRPDVALRVTRFLPEVAPAVEPKPIAGLKPMFRALWRDKRERECRKVAPALELNSRS
jgi:hypothetical protein